CRAVVVEDKHRTIRALFDRVTLSFKTLFIKAFRKCFRVVSKTCKRLIPEEVQRCTHGPERSVTAIVPHRSSINEIAAPCAYQVPGLQIVDVVDSRRIANCNGMCQAFRSVATEVEECSYEPWTATRSNKNRRCRIV